MSKEDFLKEIRKGIQRMRSASSEITLVHHNDADGLTASTL